MRGPSGEGLFPNAVAPQAVLIPAGIGMAGCAAARASQAPVLRPGAPAGIAPARLFRYSCLV